MENDWYAGWSWLLWFGFIMIMFSSFGNWGYTYRAHRRFNNEFSQKNADDILKERYASGEIEEDEFLKKMSQISEVKKINKLKSSTILS